MEEEGVWLGPGNEKRGRQCITCVKYMRRWRSMMSMKRMCRSNRWSWRSKRERQIE